MREFQCSEAIPYGGDNHFVLACPTCDLPMGTGFTGNGGSIRFRCGACGRTAVAMMFDGLVHWGMNEAEWATMHARVERGETGRLKTRGPLHPCGACGGTVLLLDTEDPDAARFCHCLRCGRVLAYRDADGFFVAGYPPPAQSASPSPTA